MAREILKSDLRIGDKVQIKPEVVTIHSDWRNHKDDIGTITNINWKGLSSITYNFRIIWPDGSTSAAGIKELNLIQSDWDE